MLRGDHSDLSHHLYLSSTDFPERERSSPREILMGKPVVLGTLLPRVQRFEGPKVGKAILSVSMPSGRIEEVGRKMERKCVL